MGKKLDLSVLKEHEEILKRIALPVIVAVALIFFWIFGGGDGDVVLETDGNGDLPQTSESQDFESQDSSVMGETAEPVIYVDIGGEVCYPGVYEVTQGTRLFQVIEMAGGLKESAATDAINQAKQVSDGQKILIESTDESSPYYIGADTGSQNSENSGDSGTSETGSSVSMTEDGVKVNINKATSEELQLIPGIGPSTAQKIIDYRQENGNFGKIEDLKNISGIGEKTFENMRDYIEI